MLGCKLLLHFLWVSTNIGQKQIQIKTVLKIFTLAVLYMLWVSQPLQSSLVVNWIFCMCGSHNSYLQITCCSTTLECRSL